MLAGDELELFRQTADTLPDLYEQRNAAGQTAVHILERPDVLAGLQDMFIAAVLIVAMFMGCRNHPIQWAKRIKISLTAAVPLPVDKSMIPSNAACEGTRYRGSRT